MRAEYADNDAITDDMASQAYTEQFALEVFDRADNAVRANQVTGYGIICPPFIHDRDSEYRQTADTFQAAVTFLNLLRIWSQPNPDITSKIKYAKYHALRIAKAIKANEDPNRSNPTPLRQSTDVFMGPAINALPSPLIDRPTLDGEGLTGAATPRCAETDSKLVKYQAHVEDEDPSDTWHLGPASRDLAVAAAPIPVNTGVASNRATAATSPIKKMHADYGVDDYYRSLSPSVSEPNPLVLPSAPPDEPMSDFRAGQNTITESADKLLPARTETIGVERPSIDVHNPYWPPPDQPQHPIDHARSPLLPSKLPNAPPSNLPPAGVSRTIMLDTIPDAPASVAESVYATDEEAIVQSIKHAKWAISALNFEDVKTAARELRIALDALEVQRR